jgi:hypothetical protein
MSIEQQITWTVLPNGIDNKKRARLSIFVSPRLKTDENLPRPVLKQFDDFVAWPKMLAGLGFRLRMDSGWSLDVKPNLSALDDDLWGSLFPDDTFVRPYEFPDYSQRVILTYPLRSVVATLKNTYQTVGIQSPGELPGILTSGHPNQALWELSQELGRVLERKEKREKKGGGVELRDPFDDTLHELKVLVPGRHYTNFFNSQTGFLSGQPLLQPSRGRYRGAPGKARPQQSAQACGSARSGLSPGTLGAGRSAGRVARTGNHPGHFGAARENLRKRRRHADLGRATRRRASFCTVQPELDTAHRLPAG